MSLEIRSIGEVTAYHTVPRTEFLIGIGTVNSKLSGDATLTFKIQQFLPIEPDTPSNFTNFSPQDIIYFHGSVTKIDSATQTIDISCFHTKKLPINSPNPLNDFTYITAIGSVTGSPHITETTASYDITVSQYVKTVSQGAYETFIVTAFHSPQNKYLLSHTKVYHPGSRVKIDGPVELYENILYCDVQNSTFVIPKSTTQANDRSHNNNITPPSSSRTNTVRTIAAEKSTHLKKPKTEISDTTTNNTPSEVNNASPSTNTIDESNDESSTDATPTKPTTNKPNNPKKRTTNIRELAVKKLRSRK